MKAFDIHNFDKYREDNRLEVKKASGGLPNSLWDTYSSFANSYGGVILLGVVENNDGSFKTSDLKNTDKLTKDFWDTINNSSKTSINLLTDDDIESFEVNGDTKKVSQGFIFDAVKLQDQELYSEDFAQFLYELEYFKKLGCNWNSMIEYTGSDIKIIYYIPVSSFSVVTSMVDDWINYTAKKDFYSVLAKEDFESRFEADLQAHTANIKDEIESRGKYYYCRLGRNAGCYPG